MRIGETLRQGAGFVAVAALGLVWRLGLGWQPMDRLAGTVTDDMFYYLTLASNFVQGNGIVFGGAPTNGFHPLHFLLCAGVLKLGLDAHAVVHLLLTISSLLGLATAAVIAGMVWRITQDRFWSLCAFALFCLNPYLILEDLNGLETALYGFFLAASLALYVSLRTRPQTDWRAWLGFGLLAGLTLASRTEGALLGLAVMLDAAWQFFRRRLDLRRGLAYGLAGAAALAVISPWLWWNWSVFGTLQQDSSKIAPFLAQRTLAINLGHTPDLVDTVLDGVVILGRNLYTLACLLFGIPTMMGKKLGLPLLFLAAGLLVPLIPGLRASWRDLKSSLRPLAPGLVFMLAVLGYYSFYHRFTNVRYFYAVLIVLIPALILAAAGLPGNGLRAAWRRRYLMAMIVAVLTLASFQLLLRQDNYPWQRKMYQAAVWMRNSLPEGARVAAFNAGIYGFWSGRNVANLDGVTNHEIFGLMKSQRLMDYLDREQIQYICDMEPGTAYYLQSFDPRFDPRRLRVLRSFGRFPTPAGPSKEEVVVFELEPPPVPEVFQ